MATGLDHRSLLSSGFRVSSRHGSLGAAVSWSYGLLDAGLQQVFVDLSVFSGSFDAAARPPCAGPTPADDRRAGQPRGAIAGHAGPGPPVRAAGDAAGVRGGGARAHGPGGGRRRAPCPPQAEWVGRAAQRLIEPGEPVLVEIDAAIPELRSALAWLLDHDELELAGRASGLLHYGCGCARRPGVVRAGGGARPDDRSPVAPSVLATASTRRGWPGTCPESSRRAARSLRLAEQAGGEIPPDVLAAWASCAVRGPAGHCGGLVPALGRRLGDVGDLAQRDMSAASELLALAYAGRPEVTELADRLLTEVGNDPTPPTAYVWYCAGEADLAVDVERARCRYTRPCDWPS